MCVHVNTLPDDCLLCIFDRIPLLDLLTLNRVCKRWKCLLPSACARRHILVLIGGEDIELNRMKFHIPFNNSFDVSFDGGRPYFGLPAVERDNALTLPYRDYLDYLDDRRTDDDDDLTELDRLHRAHHSGQLATYLTALLPNIDKLVVIYPENATGFDQHELHSVIQLVGSTWSLKILKIWIGAIYFGRVSQYRTEQDAVRTLLQTIPRQSSSLQKLTLDIDGGEIFDGDEEDDYGEVVDEEANNANDAPNPYPLELYSFISQLKEVKIYFCDAHYSICDIMHQFGSAQLMQNIGLGNDDDFGSLATVLDPKFEFTTKVSQLYVDMEFESVGLFSQFCGRFPALTSLWIVWSPDIITFTQLVANLASLSQLTHLYLDIDFVDQPENVFALVDRVNDDGEELQISVLPSVKVLQLAIEKRSHDDFESLSPLVFPSVEVVILDYITHHYSTQCIICRPYEDRYVDGDVDPTDRCHRLMILSLKSKFANNNLRLYAERGHGQGYKDWTDYVRTEEDALPVIGDDDGQVDEQPKVVEA